MKKRVAVAGAVVALVGVAFAAAGVGCKKNRSPVDGGVGAEGATLPSAEGHARLPGPAVTPEGPRAAAIAEVHRVVDAAALRKDPALSGVGKHLEEAVRDVYGDAALRARIEKMSGEPLRAPSSIVLERLEIGGAPNLAQAPQLWRVTYEAWCGRSAEGSAGYKSDHLLMSRVARPAPAPPEWRLVRSYRPGCDESGEPEVQRIDLDGDRGEDLVASYATTRLGAENHLQLHVLRRTATGFVSEDLLHESSPFQTLEVRYLPGKAGARELHFRTFREEKQSCALFERTVVYAYDATSKRFVRGKESQRPVTPKALADEGEDVDAQCEKP